MLRAQVEVAPSQSAQQSPRPSAQNMGDVASAAPTQQQQQQKSLPEGKAVPNQQPPVDVSPNGEPQKEVVLYLRAFGVIGIIYPLHL